MYVTRQAADCDSPAASNRSGTRPPSGFSSIGRRSTAADLGEDVEGPRVPRVLELAVALRGQQLQVDALHEAPAVDPHLLGRHADPDVALGGEVTVEETPVGRRVDARRHVVPLHDDRSAEPVGVEGTSYDEARPERRLGARRHIPVPVRSPLPLQLVRGRRPLQAELRLPVAERRQVVVPHDIRRGPRHLLELCPSCAGHCRPSRSGRRARLDLAPLIGILFIPKAGIGPAHATAQRNEDTT